MNVEEFESDLKKSLEVLERISGDKVMGFRAPFFSINKQNLWAFDVLRKYLHYDSSIFPVGFHYGLADAPRHIYRMSNKDPLMENPDGKFIEIPMTTLKLPLIGNFPIGGGHYLRFLPFNILNRGIKKFNEAGFPAIFYIHPKDLDPDTPRIPGYAWHNYWGLTGAAKKFRSTLQRFRFSSVRDALAK
jgi:hypothetical protein